MRISIPVILAFLLVGSPVVQANEEMEAAAACQDAFQVYIENGSMAANAYTPCTVNARPAAYWRCIKGRAENGEDIKFASANCENAARVK